LQRRQADHSDKDWGYVALTKDSAGAFRWSARNVSIEAQEEAESQLKVALPKEAAEA
jgi:hypothetical protein